MLLSRPYRTYCRFMSILQSTSRVPRHQGYQSLRPADGRWVLVASQPADVHLSRWSLPILSSASSMTTEFPRMTCSKDTVSPDNHQKTIATGRNIPPCLAELSLRRPSPPRHRQERCSRRPGRGVSTWYSRRYAGRRRHVHRSRAEYQSPCGFRSVGQTGACRGTGRILVSDEKPRAINRVAVAYLLQFRLSRRHLDVLCCCFGGEVAEEDDYSPDATAGLEFG